MKILVICQYYYPEPFSITNICEELVKHGHEVTVVTGIPNYPMGKIYDGYRRGKKRDEVINGVNVHRCFTVGRRSGPIWRFINYYSYMFSSTRYVSRIKERFDVVFVNQLSPVMMAKAGIKYKKKNGTKMLMYCLDLWPESLVTGGIKRESLIFKIFHRVSEKIYKQADKILVTSACFKDYFKSEFNISDCLLGYLPQYSEDLFTYDSCKKEKDGFIDLMFAGNIGAAQNVDLIIKAAVLLKNDTRYRWHIVGDGSELEKCRKLASQLGADNVIFYGRQSPEKMPEFYSKADIMLVNVIDDPIISLTLPGKVQTYMAAGKPILAAATGETEKVIKDADCGICCPPNDAEAFAKAAKELAESRKMSEYGFNGYNYYKKNFSKEKFFNKLENEIEMLR